MPMSKEECGGHRTNVIPAFGHKRDKCIASFVSKSPKTPKSSDVPLRMLVAGRRVPAAHGIRLRFYVLSELFNQLFGPGHHQNPVPPQNPVDRTIVDVSALGVKQAYPDGRRAASSLHTTHTSSVSMSSAYCVGLGSLPRSTGGCRAVGNVRKGPSSVRLVPFAIVAAHISRSDDVLRNDKMP